MGSTTYTGTIGTTVSGTLTAGGSVGNTNGGTKAITETQTSGWSSSTGKSLSYEQQNSLAIELEHIADKLIRRLRAGLNSGIWETFITYTTLSSTSSRVLAGSLCGELIKADPDSLPARIFDAKLPDSIQLFLPEWQPGSTLLTANKLTSHMSSEEAALLMAPPLASVPGCDIRVKPALSLTDQNINPEAKSIAHIAEHGRVITGSTFAISNYDIRKHIFVTGLTGSGKTTTVKQIIHSSAGTPFLVLESAKREYRRLLAHDQYKNSLRVYTVGDATISPFRHNPFMILPGVSAVTHIDNLKAIFNASFSLYGPMPYILEQSLHSVYRAKGWNLTTGQHHSAKIASIDDCRSARHIYPTIRDLANEVNRYVLEELEYKGELRDNIRSAIVARLESLAVGAKGFIFNTHDFADIGDLLGNQVVFELESLMDDDDKAFFVGLILTLVSEYRQSTVGGSGLNLTDDLKHILVIEEAHRLLKNTATERSNEFIGNPRGKAVETFCNVIAEMRSLGQGVIVAEQIPTNIAPDVVKNTNTKIAHRLVCTDDQNAIGSGLGLPHSDHHYLNQLTTGFALAHKEGMAKPVEIRVNSNIPNAPLGNDYIREIGKRLYGQSLEEDLALHDSGLLDSPLLQTTARRLINAVFLSAKELQEVAPVAIEAIRQHAPCDYVTDFTIMQALESWFNRTLFSLTMNMGKGKKVTSEVMMALDRFWNDQRRFGRDRLVRALDDWIEGSILDQVRDFAALSIGRELPKNSEGELSLRKLIERNLLTNDPEVAHKIHECLRKRIM